MLHGARRVVALRVVALPVLILGVAACGTGGDRAPAPPSTTPAATAPPPAAPETAPTVAEVCVGRAHSCARASDGRVACWGDNELGQIAHGGMASIGEPRWTGLEDAVEIACGARETCARTAAGEVRCLGAGGLEGLGLPGPARGITLGGRGGCARLDDDGRSACWQAPGRDAGPDARTASLQVGAPIELGDVGAEHRCALEGGAIVCRGSDGYGQLGVGSGWHPPSPIDGVEGARSLAAARHRACAIDGADRLWCWGHSPRGVEPPTVVREAVAADARLEASEDHVCVVQGRQRDCLDLVGDEPRPPCRIEGGRAICRTVSRVGTEPRPGPELVVESPDARAVTGWFERPEPDPGLAICALTGGGEVRCHAVRPSSAHRTPPRLSEIEELRAGAADGADTVCARARGGAVLCWGDPRFGQRGRASDAGFDEVTAVPGVDDAVELAVGGDFACARREGGAVACWGSERNGGAPGRLRDEPARPSWPPPQPSSEPAPEG